MNQKIGVTTFVNKMFPFERNRWTHVKNYEDFNKDKSNKLHSDIESYLKDNIYPVEYPEFNAFIRLLNDENLIHISSEVTIENDKFIGKYDSLFNKNGKLILIDWKSIGEIDTIGYGNDITGKYTNCNYNKYGTQLLIYSGILKEKDININELWIVNLKFGKYYIYKIDKLRESGNIEFNKYIIPFGKHKGKKFNQLKPKELDFLCCSTIFNQDSNLLNISNSVFFKIEKEMKHLLDLDNASMINIIKNLYSLDSTDSILKIRIYIILHHPETINMARQYADNLKFCIGCFMNETSNTNDYLCNICMR